MWMFTTALGIKLYLAEEYQKGIGVFADQYIPYDTIVGFYEGLLRNGQFFGDYIVFISRDWCMDGDPNIDTVIRGAAYRIGCHGNGYLAYCNEPCRGEHCNCRFMVDVRQRRVAVKVTSKFGISKGSSLLIVCVMEISTSNHTTIIVLRCCVICGSIRDLLELSGKF